jgi:hypothetical protein
VDHTQTKITKSQFVAGAQCLKRLYLLVHGIPIASSGVSQPPSADSSANFRIAERCELIVEADRLSPSRCDR